MTAGNRYIMNTGNTYSHIVDVFCRESINISTFCTVMNGVN